MRPHAYPRAYLIGILVGSTLERFTFGTADKSVASWVMFIIRMLAMLGIGITMYLDMREDAQKR